MPLGTRSKRIVDEYLDRIGVNVEFTVKEIFANLDNCKCKPNTREIAAYVRKYAKVTDLRYDGQNLVAYWEMVV